MRAIIHVLPAAVLLLATFLATSAAAVAAPLLADALAAEDRVALAEAVRREGDPLRGANVFHGWPRQAFFVLSAVASDEGSTTSVSPPATRAATSVLPTSVATS
jgi:hypothetical protein